MKTTLLLLVLFVSLLTVPAIAQTKTNHSFAITTGDGAIITDTDIVEYRFAEHTMKIRGDSLGRMSRLRLTASGIPFRVFADGAEIYQGRLVSRVSSMSFKEPIILMEVDTNEPVATVTIHGPHYHEPRFQTGNDPRGDARITRALAALNKLTPGFSGGINNHEAFTLRLAEIMKECQQLKPGATRAELMKIFTTEGGISNAKQRTFPHRHCPYIKVDVQFNLTDPKQSVVKELPTDTITKISQPYLAWSIID